MTRFAVLAVLALATRAFADDAKTESQKHLQESAKLFQLGNFAEALTEIMTAYTLDPQPAYTFTIAQIHVKLGECGEAIDWYKKFLDSHPSAKATTATKQAIATCEKQLKKEHPEAATKPAPNADTASGNPNPDTGSRNPNPTSETVSRNSNPSTETGSGAPSPNPSATVEVSGSASAQPGGSPAPVAELPESHHAWYSDPLVDGCVIGGLVAGAAGIVFYRSALDDYDRAETATTYSAHHQLIQNGQSARNVSLIVGGGGAALLAAGVVLFVVRDRDEPAVAVTPTSGGAAVTYGGHF